MKHRIQRQQFLVTLPPAIDAFRAQQAAARFFHAQLLPMLEKIFDELSNDDQVLHLDSLSIDLGVLNLASLNAVTADETIYRRLRDEVARMIEGELAARPQLRRSMGLKAWDTWRYYMEHGYLPWNGDPPDYEDLQRVLAHLAVDYEAVSWLRRAMQPGAYLLARVVAQHDEEFLRQLVTVLTASRQPDPGAVIGEVIQLFRLLARRHQELGVSGGAGSHGLARGGEAGGPAIDADLTGSLERWAKRMAWFPSGPEPQQRAILWQQLLAGAAARPADVVRGGAPGLLLKDMEEEPLLLEIVLAEKRGDNDSMIRSWLVTAYDRARSRGPANEREDDRHGGKPGASITPTADHGSGGPNEKTGPKTTEENASASQDGDGGDSLTSHLHEQSGLPARDPHPGEKTGVPDIRPGKGASGIPGGMRNDPEATVGEEGIYVHNAGLVLLHPFLSTLFRRAGYWDGGGFKDAGARQQAVGLVYYLATGEQHAPEYALAFPKVLCGYPLELPMPGEWELAGEALEEAGVLLESVLARWEKLGNTSVAGLRESFLQRGGKLTRRDGRFVLQMETAGIDVLLDYLPWNLALVKLPWWRDILNVEWR